MEPLERFYLKLVDLEAAGLRKLDNYQNFAKAFRASSDWSELMADMTPNAARLKTSAEFGTKLFGEGFGETPLRHVLWAMHQLQRDDADGRKVLDELRTMPRYYEKRRDAVQAMARYLAVKRKGTEGAAAKTLADLISNERLG